MPHKPVFFEGSVEEAITACSQAQNLLLVFLHGEFVTSKNIVSARLTPQSASAPPMCDLRVLNRQDDPYVTFYKVGVASETLPDDCERMNNSAHDASMFELSYSVSSALITVSNAH